MNWFKKIASVTFSIGDTHNVMQPMNVMDISSDLINFIYYVKHLKDFGINYNSIVPDMSSTDIFASTGIINFYQTSPDLTLDVVKSIINDYNQNKDPFIKLQVVKEDRSGVSKHNVFRINIVKNETSEIEGLPEFNISNSNAIALLNLLSQHGVNTSAEDLSGVMDANKVDAAINDILTNDYQLNSFIEKPSNSFGEQGAEIYDFGRTTEQLKRYLNELKKIIQYIHSNNLPNATIAYS